MDGLIKALLVIGRSVEETLETRAVAKATKEPLSQTKVRVLRLLDRQGSQTSSQVARFLGVTKPAVTQTIDSMQDAKLVRRKPGKADRRQILLELTKRGSKLLSAVRQEQRQILRNTIKLADKPSLTKWIDTLQSIAGSLARADGKYDGYCLQCSAHADDACVLGGGKKTSCSYVKHAGGGR